MILTQQEAFNVLRIDSIDECPQLQMLMVACDDSIKSATGFNWGILTSTYTTIDPTAKIVASLLLIHLYEGADLLPSYNSFIGQLHAKVINGEVQ